MIPSSHCLELSPSCKQWFLNTTDISRRVLTRHQILLAGWSELHAPYRIERWNCEHHIAIYTINGGGDLLFSGEKLAMLPGSLTYIPIWSDHEYRARRDWTIVWFHFEPEVPWFRVNLTEPKIFPALNLNPVRRLTKNFLDAMDRDCGEQSLLLESYTQALMCLLKQEFAVDPQKARRTLRLEKIWALATEDLSCARSIEDLCGVGHISRAQFQRDCKEVYGMSCGQKLTSIRINEASSLLVHTDESMDEISRRVGYANAFVFSRAFRRATGVNPSCFRQQSRRSRAHLA